MLNYLTQDRILLLGPSMGMLLANTVSVIGSELFVSNQISDQIILLGTFIAVFSVLGGIFLIFYCLMQRQNRKGVFAGIGTVIGVIFGYSLSLWLVFHVLPWDLSI